LVRTGEEGRKQKDSTFKLDNAIIETIANMAYPAGPRALAYAMESKGLIAKTEHDFNAVQDRCATLRRQGRIPFAWVADNARSIAYVARHDSAVAALRDWQQSYRRDMWQAKDYAAEVWIEKAGMLPAVEAVTDRYGVPVYIAKGFSGIGFIWEAAQSIKRRGKPTYVAHLGDYDKAGRDAARAIERDLRGFGADVQFTELCVNQEQIEAWKLQTRPPKARDKGFDRCVELDAVPMPRLQRTLIDWLAQFVSVDDLRANDTAEQSEREMLEVWTNILAQAEEGK
jgi:hypothetical protein